ncbi:hypothetical protein [Stappia sp.]|uniref:hypothetical protein n=1 Tax=Stappia sp. TaxID=1870903 RepID=UPI003C7EBF80
MRIGRIEEDDWSVRRAATSSGVFRRTTDRRYARDPGGGQGGAVGPILATLFLFAGHADPCG